MQRFPPDGWDIHMYPMLGADQHEMRRRTLRAHTRFRRIKIFPKPTLRVDAQAAQLSAVASARSGSFIL
jgi:hypothetical protein